MASLTQRTWVWADSGRWWRTGKPGMLQSMGSQRVRHDWTPEQQQLKGTNEAEKNGRFKFWDRNCTKWDDLPCIRKQRSYQRPPMSCQKDLGTKLKGFPVPKYWIIMSIKKSNYSGFTHIKYVPVCKMHELKIQWFSLEDVGERTHSEHRPRKWMTQTFILSFLIGYLIQTVDEEKSFCRRTFWWMDQPGDIKPTHQS